MSRPVGAEPFFYLRVAEEGEGDSEARALALGAFDLDIALMRFSNPFTNG